MKINLFFKNKKKGGMVPVVTDRLLRGSMIPISFLFLFLFPSQAQRKRDAWFDLLEHCGLWAVGYIGLTFLEVGRQSSVNDFYS